MRFANRTQAGAVLAEMLMARLGGSNLDTSSIVVVGLPRGGVPVALEVARQLRCPLEIIVAKKLPYPGQPEFAIGAVSSDGVVALNQDLPQDPAWQEYINGQRRRLLTATSDQEGQFYGRAMRKQADFTGKTVVVVDDGIATGMTAIAALDSARARGARRTILAAPVMSPHSFQDLTRHCDEVVALLAPQDFRAVGQYYLDFSPTSDNEVVQALKDSTHFVGRQINGTFKT